MASLSEPNVRPSSQYSYHFKAAANFSALSFFLSRSMSSDAEVTGPEDTGYLSILAPFRLAKEEIRAQTQQRIESSPIGSDLPSSPTIVRPPPIISMSQKDIPGSEGEGGRNSGILENAAFPLDRIQLASTTHPTPAHDGQDVSTEIHGGLTKEMIDLSDLTEDYSRMADEMANYISWDISELPSWLDFDISSSNI